MSEYVSKTKLSWNGHFSFGGSLFLSDIILIENQIVLFFKVKMFKLITVEQNSLQLSEKDTNSKKYDGIDNHYFIDKKESINTKVKYEFSYKNKANGLNVKSTLLLDFKERNEDKKLVFNYLN